MQKPTIALFDMDGTTVRHIDPRVLSLLEWLDDIAYNGAKLISRLLKRPVTAPPLVGRRDGRRQKLLVQRAMHQVRRWRQKSVRTIVEPCPGIYPLLDLLQAHGVRLGIISNGLGKGYGYDVLQTFGLEKYYEVTIFREDINRPKPAPDPVLRAVEKMLPAPDAADVIWYFGDRRKDILSALAAREFLPCPLEPFAYNLNAVIAVLENNLGTEHIVMAWPDLTVKLQRLFAG